ncbi:chemotaxis protein CheW [Aliikangiella sp. IMCC44653]
MKLNKPPVSEEQSILEEYVEFLLVDNSNVHPIRQKIKVIEANDDKTSQDKTSESNTGAVKTSSENSKASSDLSLSKDLNESQLKVNDGDKLNPESVPENPSVSAESEPAPKVHSQPNPPLENAAVNNTSDGRRSLEQTELAQEAPEEEQLKQWDALITQEKEQTYLKEHPDENIDHRADLSAAKKADKKPAQDALNQYASNKTSHQETESLVGDYLPKPNPQTDSAPLSQESPDQRLKTVEKLLARIAFKTLPESDHSTADKTTLKNQAIISEEQQVQVEQATFVERQPEKAKDFLPEVFQTLIFKVGKLPLAVPLIKLGGISKISVQDITPMVGTPDWFIGLVPNERGSLMVIDTQKYLMPEQAVDKTQEYQYIILLDDSNWALACHSVGDAKNLTHNDVRWAEKSSRRPWFAGMVVDYMSALIEVDALINMLVESVSD